MTKSSLALLMVVALLFTGCSQKTQAPPQQPPAVQPVQPEPLPSERQVPLRRMSLQGRELLAVFSDFAGITDLALTQEGLRYISNKVLWTTKFTGAHNPLHREAEATYDKWYKEIAGLHESLRQAKDVVPKVFPVVKGDNVRLEDREYLMAYRRSDETHSLVLSHPSGSERILVQGARELAILGFIERHRLLVYADLPGLGKNAWIIDVWDDVVAFHQSSNNTMSLDNVRIFDVVAGRTGLVWRYDDRRLAYVLGGNAFLVDELGASRLLTTVEAPVVWAERGLMITFDQNKDKPPRLLYGSESLTLRHLTAPMPLYVDWENQKFYYMTREGEDTGIAVVDLTTMEDTQLIVTAEGYYLTHFALSPDHEDIMFVQVKRIAPGDGPYDNYVNEVCRLDLISGHVQMLQGKGLRQGQSFAYYGSVYWLSEGLVALGEGNDGSWGKLSFGLYRLGHDSSLSLWIQDYKHVEIHTEDLKHVFLNDWKVDGLDERMDHNVWYYDVANVHMRQLTSRQEWQIQQDQSLAYNPEQQLLFISRYKGYSDRDSMQRMVHGVLVDMQGREYTLIGADNKGIEQAVWVGDTLYVRTAMKLVRIRFER